jgi:hypothetical protein
MHARRVVLCLALAACGPDDPATPRCNAGLVAGDLVITEIMANPDGEDPGKEWFEVFARAGADLTGVRLVSSRADGSSEKAHVMTHGTAAGGDYFVLGGVLDDLRPGFVGYGYGADLGDLRNSDARLAIFCNDVLVDETTYGTIRDGVSLQLSGDRPADFLQNDNPLNWCDSTLEFQTGNQGSPGEANSTCPQVGPQTTCLEGEQMRDVVPPQAGDLVITEILSDPTKVGDDFGEWFEVVVARDVDLNGLELGTVIGTPRHTMGAAACLHVEAGARVVFARADAANGGLPSADFIFNFGLSNSGGSLFLGYDGTLIDAASYPAARAGASGQVDPSKENAARPANPT